jgi:tetratricopeptide (TPR) repeat protein
MEPAVNRTIVAVDVEGFGDTRRNNPHRVTVRVAVYRALAAAFAAADVPWDQCHHEDRGDGVLILAPPEITRARFIESIPAAVADSLAEHNATHPTQERIRLRMVLHAGEIVHDDNGVVGNAVNHAFRLLDAEPLKRALADSPGVLAVIVSSWFFDEVVYHSSVVPAATLRPVRVVAKETAAVAWIALPDHPYPPDPDQLVRPALDLVTPSGLANSLTPRQLPAAARGFVGRTAELTALSTELDDGSATGGTVVISAVAGAGGIGKTSLAVYWAHQNQHRFPDGQLFVDLRGFSPTNRPTTTGEAVHGLLDALGVEPARVPADLVAQAALFRSLVAGRRMLIVLDNAASADQVIPLLPGTPSCTVLVTSRRTLTTLIHRYGARHLTLDVLDEQQAHTLLVARLGAARLSAEPEATAELIRLCGLYPMALTILASRAQAHPHIPLAEFATELRDSVFDLLDDADPAASLPAVLSWSLHSLTAEQRRTFCLLGIAPGADIGPGAAASLIGLCPQQAKKSLRDLEEASLLSRQANGRYAMHDLIRGFAATTADHELTEREREQALKRVLDYYTHTADVADRCLAPQRQRILLDRPAPGTFPDSLFDSATALAWFDAEYGNVLAAQRTAVERGWHATVWQLAWATGTVQGRRGHRYDDLAVWRAALAATDHLSDPVPGIRAHRFLGRACANLGCHDEATEHLYEALALSERHRNPTDQAHTHRMLAWAWEQQGDDKRALDHALRSLELYRELEQPEWEAGALDLVGWYAARLGEYGIARANCQAALSIHHRHHNADGEANALCSLGYIDHRTGDDHQAIRKYQRALALCDDVGDTYQYANVLDKIGLAHDALGHRGQARAAWRESLELYERQQCVEEAKRVLGRLAGLGHADDD